jgi:hypothetical protein
VIERRKATIENLTATQKRIEELNPLLLDIENRIAASTDQTQRTELEGERSKLATEYNQMQAKEQELLAESQTLERYTSMFQTFVDSLNNQIAAQNTLINKLTIDTEQRIVLYKALEDSLKTAAQQDVAHKINTLGSQVDNDCRGDHGRHRRRRAAHIGDLLEMHEKNMVTTADIQRRKKLADDAFARRFDEVHEEAQLCELREAVAQLLRGLPYVAPLCPAGHLPQGGRSAGRATERRRWRLAKHIRQSRSPPLWGRCPAGQRGARRTLPQKDGAMTSPPTAAVALFLHHPPPSAASTSSCVTIARRFTGTISWPR